MAVSAHRYNTRAFHPPPFPLRKSLRCCSITRYGGFPVYLLKKLKQKFAALPLISLVARNLLGSVIALLICLPLVNPPAKYAVQIQCTSEFP
jgi:hypothetical protein